MEDPLQKRLDKIRSFSGTTQRRASLYRDLTKFDDKQTAQSLGAIQRASAPGRRLQKIGFIMMWVPDPTGVTCAVGGPMILAGRYLEKKFNGSTIVDVAKQTKDTVSSIHDFKNSIT